VKKNKCKQCNKKWGVSVMVSEKDYLCPYCRNQLAKLSKKKGKYK
jgi:protein-disulfide isomerase